MKNNTHRIVTIAMLSALSVLLMLLIRFPLIPAAPFLEYEPGDVPALIAAFSLGPGAGFMVTFIVSLIQAFSVSAGSGWIGAVMHIIATGSMVLAAGWFYKNNRTFKGAVISLIIGSITMTLVMIPLNLFFTTRFLNVPMEAVKAMLIPVIIPFNLLKASINSVLTVLVYKPVSRIVKLSAQENDLERA